MQALNRFIFSITLLSHEDFDANALLRCNLIFSSLLGVFEDGFREFSILKFKIFFILNLNSIISSLELIIISKRSSLEVKIKILSRKKKEKNVESISSLDLFYFTKQNSKITNKTHKVEQTEIMCNESFSSFCPLSCRLFCHLNSNEFNYLKLK